MSFLPQFSKYFSPEERATELYQLWSMIGVNTEKAILEELERINTEMTDINSFSEDTLRSWLAFFLQKIPYRITATVNVTIGLKNSHLIEGDAMSQFKYAQTNIPKYEQLKNDDGFTYVTLEDMILIGNDKRTIVAAQGRRITEQGRYSKIIKVQANNPDLSYLTVTLGGKEIPEVSYQTSYDQLTYMGSWKPGNGSEGFGGTPFLQNEYGTKGQFYTVTSDGSERFAEGAIPIEFRVGDIVVFDGVEWQRVASNNNLRPIQFAKTFAIPHNGYFAYYYDGFLYVKIYSGTVVDDPEGLDYSVSYISSDGVLGETKADTLSFVSSYVDVNEQRVEVEVSNSPSTVAVNEPGVGKLGLFLKQRLYGSISLSSIPEYTAWFKAQPEVGDCMVLSDWERYRRSGDYNLTGYIDVYLTDNNGNNLSSEMIETLLDRIEAYKDIGVLRVNEFQTIYNHFEFQYTTVNDEDSFQQYIKSATAQFYSLPYLQSINSSLFDDLDLAMVVKTIQDNPNYQSSGLIVKGYHYREQSTNNYSSFQVTSYDGERTGSGWYYATLYDADGKVIGEHHFVEDAEANGTCYIYDVEDYSVRLGTHIGNVVSFSLPLKYNCATMLVRCYWGMANEGILSIGSENGLRKLEGVSVTRVGSLDGTGL